MKNIIGVITLLALSQATFAEDMPATGSKMQLVEPEAEMMKTDTAPAKEELLKEQSGFSRGSVVRSAFTTEIAEREPTQDLQKLTNKDGEVKFFTELRDMNGQTAIHRWEYEGKVVAEVAFNVKGPRWRVWSSKSLAPQMVGDWKVSVINGAGEVIAEKNLAYDVAKAETMPASDKDMPPSNMPEPVK
ncbi:MAG: DUF2914 domain-containing protein [Gammaproteobacteria bacterium]|nr:DUF2914 domain-containing protein [Gammaproteobacteria bacterium]